MRICPVCANSELEATKDEECFRCLVCGVVRTRYSYEANQYGLGYAQNYLQYAESPQNLSLNLFRLGLVARWLQPNSEILDIGCCVGAFIRFAENYYYCDGFEPNPYAEEQARKRTRSPIFA